MKFGRAMVLTVVLVLFASWAYADDCNIVRYVDNLDGTMTDCRSNLIWLKNANCTFAQGGPSSGGSTDGSATWNDAMTWVAGLHDTGTPGTGCGLSDGSSAGDWRLPTKTELMAMIISAKKQKFGSPALTNAAGTGQWVDGAIYDFQNVQSDYYWSSTTYAPNTAGAWCVYMYDGYVCYDDKIFSYYVWPVRGGQSGSFGNLIIQ